MQIEFYSQIRVCAEKKFAVGSESHVALQACLR
jgi:hypothetical protein